VKKLPSPLQGRHLVLANKKIIDGHLGALFPPARLGKICSVRVVALCEVGTSAGSTTAVVTLDNAVIIKAVEGAAMKT
jgi:hypothetical protein